jgi:hypothetical protein
LVSEVKLNADIGKTDEQISQRFPFGATVDSAGANFNGFPKNAAATKLAQLDTVDKSCPARTISLDRQGPSQELSENQPTENGRWFSG